MPNSRGTKHQEDVVGIPGSSVSPAAQSTPDGGRNDEPDEDSDSSSGNSLFITQAPVPAPPVRSPRRRSTESPTQRKTTTTTPRRRSTTSRQARRSHQNIEDEEDEDSDSDGVPSAPPRDSRAVKERRRSRSRRRERERYELPAYNFPFLAKTLSKPRKILLPRLHNTRLHNAATTGFFKCVREMHASRDRGYDWESSLPTVDTEEDVIVPLTEEEEKPERDDIRVVDRKCLLAPSRAKNRPQSWWSQFEQKSGGNVAVNATQETSRGRGQSETQREKPSKASVSRPTPIARMREEGGSIHLAQGRSDRNSLARTGTPKARKSLYLGDNNFLQSPGRNSQTDRRKASKSVPETQSDKVPHTDPGVSRLGQWEDEPESQNLARGLPDLTSTDNESACSESMAVKRREKKRKKKKKTGDCEIVEEGEHQSREEPECLNTAVLVCEEEEEEGSHRRKKKRKRHGAENIREEVDGHLESDLRTENYSEKTCDVEPFQPDAICEPPNDGAEIKTKKKKKRKRDPVVVTAEREEEDAGTSRLTPVSTRLLEEHGSCVGDSAAFQEPLEESSHAKKKRHKKKRLLSKETTLYGEEDADLSFSNVTVTFAETNETSPKTKKRKTTSDSTGISDPAEGRGEFESVDNVNETEEERGTVRKKKRRLLSDDATLDGQEDGNSGSGPNDSVTFAKTAETPTKKKKKKHKTISDCISVSYPTGEGVGDAQRANEGFERQNAEVVSTKKKKKKKRSEMSSGYISGEDVMWQNDGSASVGPNVTMTFAETAETPQKKKKKKHKAISHCTGISYATGGNGNVESVGDARKAHKGLEEQNAELASTQKKKKRKKKKKRSEMSSGYISGEDVVSQNDDLASVGDEKRKKRTSSFLEADAVEKDSRAHGGSPPLPDDTRTPHGEHFKEPGEPRQKKKKHKGIESEPATPAMQTVDSDADVAAALTKKKKKKKTKCNDESLHAL